MGVMAMPYYTSTVLTFSFDVGMGQIKSFDVVAGSTQSHTLTIYFNIVYESYWLLL